MKRRKVVVGISVVCLFIAAIAIQATFGSEPGLRIEPEEITVKPGSTITYTITLSSRDSDCFDVTIIPYTCKKEWFEWTEKKQVCVAAGGETKISLDVTPTEKGNFEFRVEAVSKSNPIIHGSAIALIKSEPPTPTPTPTPAPTCIGLMPNLPEPQKIMTKYGTKEIKWTAFACDSDEDQIWYRFSLKGPGTGGMEQIVQDWSASNEWVWSATLSDVGYSTIYVDVRDGYHHTDSTTPDYDDSCVYNDYEIKENQPPYCACLMPDKSEPQTTGTPITWTACAIDPEGDQDQLWYRFWLKGPETGNVWESRRYWSTSNTWTWIPTTSGAHDIEVWIRDNFIPPLSEDPESWDVYATYWTYEIT